ncbi:MAG: hypothetical protein AB7S26_41905 [Sandaracinaceae bacterium]
MRVESASPNALDGGAGEVYPSAMDGMGAKLSEHGGMIRAGGWGWYMGVIMVLAGFGNLVAGVKAMIAGTGTLLEAVALTLVCFVIGALILLSPILRWRQHVTLYENGLVWRRLTGEKTIARSDVKRVQRTIHRSRYGSYDEVEIETPSGWVSIKGIDGSEQIANTVSAWLRGGSAPATGWAPPSSGGAPPASGGWTPPGQGGAPPASGGSGWTPPASGGGWTPPGSGG